MDKNKARHEMINELKNIPLQERIKIEETFYYHLFQSALWQSRMVIGTTISRSFEWNTKPIIEQAWRECKVLCIPKSDPLTKKMDFFQITPDTVLQTGYGAILEPNPQTTTRIEKQAIELLLVPGIVFDNQGYRIGFGGGFYDRFLIDFMNPTISFVSSRQLIPNVHHEAHDVPVKYMITENGWIQTRKRK